MANQRAEENLARAGLKHEVRKQIAAHLLMAAVVASPVFTAFAASAAFLALATEASIRQRGQITLRSLDGSTFDLGESRGQVVVILFSALSSPLTAESMAAFQKLADRFAERGVAFYWVSINSATAGEKGYAANADLQTFAGQHGPRLRVLRDPEQSAFRALGVNAAPAVVIIDRAGEVRGRLVGFDPGRPRPYGEIGRALRQLLRSESGGS